ncbi:unnamed protein product [Zymoseptoria tritici ST99CH_3D7]|uniref:UvrD-like helicase ATP-binding domain-containing protein n=1 Tax=Zymoseptoria tritici (strain ST99CH_3D7) TaxID=1276538 RepID=A0A1X7RU19_ZYMT9|nr:unnamed protein product [Zymoseptoria tritici ST99CH_3D7]
MGEVLVKAIQELTALDQDIHWFCPRSTSDDFNIYYDEDHCNVHTGETPSDRAVREGKIEEATQRREKVMLAMQILAYDGADAVAFQKSLTACLTKQLSRCDICIREYHRSRTSLRQSLEEDYPEEDVQSFLKKYDDMNAARIISGLNSMTEALVGLPEEQRKITSAGDEAMYAMFEALQSVPFLRNEEALQQYFDRPFAMAQSKRKFTLPAIAPGMVAFLFSKNPMRLSWATRNFGRVKRPMLANEFEYSVRPFLEPAMNRVHVVSLELEFLPTFWSAVKLIVSKLTPTLVAQNLRKMNGNLLTLSLDHFQIDANHFSDLIAVYVNIIELSPQDFWAAMGAVNPQNVIENICRAPRLEQILTRNAESMHNPVAEINAIMAWVDSFVRSIKPGILVPPLRTMLNQLMLHYQGDQYSHWASSVAWHKGLTSILEAIRRISETVDGGPVYAHLIEAVSKDHIANILHELSETEHKEEFQLTVTQGLDLEVVENILALDLKSLARDRRVILRNRELDHEISQSNLNVWNLSTRHVKPGRPHLVIHILTGVQGILTLEMMPPNAAKDGKNNIDHKFKPICDKWDSALDRVLNIVSIELLERIDSFGAEQLTDLFQEFDGARGLMALLFSGDDRVHQSALSVLKSLSGEDGRRGSLRHLLLAFFAPALGAVSHALKLISDAKVFGPCPTALKLIRDIYGSLCDSEDGILRSRAFTDEQDLDALRKFWFQTWTTLETIFEQTELWSAAGFPKAIMSEFCRETMDFADFAFHQYSLIAATFEHGGKPKSSMPVGKTLLQFPSKAFKFIAKWLRLRDEYLIEKAVGLISNMLVRLQENDLKISSESLKYIEDIILSTEKDMRVKTKLTPNHKAELQQALEKHIGHALAPAEPEIKLEKKQKTLDSKKPKNAIDLEQWKSAAAKQEKRPDLAKKLPARPNAAAKLAAQKANIGKDFLEKRKAAKAEAERTRLANLAKANGLGAGSGVAGLGDFGKDHAVKGQNVMVSSDESEDEDDDSDDLDDDLFGPSIKKQQRPGLDLTGAIGLKAEAKKGPTKIKRTARSLRDMRARLAPDLGSLHRMILGWDYFHQGDYPPGSNPHEFSQVSDSFSDPVTYQQTFEPLLLLEAWQGLVQSRLQDNSKPYEIKVGNRNNVDQFVEINSVLGQKENRDLQIMEGDIILFSKSPRPVGDSTTPNCLARVYRIKREKGQLQIVYQFTPGSSLASQITPQTIIHGVKVQSITPLEREYGALKALQYYDLCNQIVRARPSQRIEYSEKQISNFQDVYDVNRAQSEAINAALENEGFSLIQGPPGSGKTKTIVAIVGGLLTHTLSSAYKGATRISMPNGNANADGAVKKLLVCAPSNAAVDEIVMRLKEGVKTKDGRSHDINVVRIGRSERINAMVGDVTMEELVQKKLGGNQMDEQKRKATAELFKEHQQVSHQLQEMYTQRNANEKMEESERKKLDDNIGHVRRRKAELGSRIDQTKDRELAAGREQELNRKRAQQAVLDEAHVICATLSGSGHDMFQSLNIEFETVIIDEAAQCVEMSSLIPLKYGCVKCIMVGDPKQLPPTVFSKEAARFQYEQSLFVRMQNNFPNEVHLLDTQYRMHPDISAFPSATFYDHKLKDGSNMAALRKKPWHASNLLAPYRFYDVKGQHSAAPKGFSLVNHAEVEVAMALYSRLTTDFGSTYDFSNRIGIITPYKSQLELLRKKFSTAFGLEILEKVEFNTTDAFQGREAEIIIFSCVRASDKGGVGFLQDIRRMNVGLTRAKCSLWVLGNSESLSRGQYWRLLIEDVERKGAMVKGDLMGMLRTSSNRFPAKVVEGGKVLGEVDHDETMGKTPVPAKNGAAVKNNGAAANGAGDVDDNGMEEDRMEGVRYRYQDRVAATKAADKTTQSGRAGEDVEMADAGLDDGFDYDDFFPATTSGGALSAAPSRAVSKSATVSANASASGSRAGTPLANPSRGTSTATTGSKSATPADGLGGMGSEKEKLRDQTPNANAPPPPPTVVKKVLKRPAAASPFIPKKPRPTGGGR